MKSITKKLAVLGLLAAGVVGCAESNESAVMKKDDGTTTGQGVNPPGEAGRGGKAGSANFNSNNKGAMQGTGAAQYKKDIQGQ